MGNILSQATSENADCDLMNPTLLWPSLKPPSEALFPTFPGNTLLSTHPESPPPRKVSINPFLDDPNQTLSAPLPPVKVFIPLDPTELSTESQLVTDFIASYYQNVESYPVQPSVQPGFLTAQLPETAPFLPEPMQNILQDVKEKIVPGLTHWQSPNFHAYFPLNSSNVGMMGELLCAGLNVINFTWKSCPAATELENVVVDWMGKMIGLPPPFLFSGGHGGGGVLHANTCEAVVCTLAAARDKTLAKIGDDMCNKLVVYCSDQTHFTVRKGAKIVGIRPSNIKSIATSKVNDFGLCPVDLRNAIERDLKAGLVPIYFCGTIGTTALGAVDPIRELGKVAREFDIWFHIDAAYAGSACVCPEFQHYMDGVELADSFSMNVHKWLLSNNDCCFLWLRFPKFLIQSLSADGTYLTGDEGVVDYKDWQIALSRKFRAIKVWMILRRYGVNNLREHIRSDVRMAVKLEERLMADERFEIMLPRKFSLVCFRLRSKKTLRSDELDELDVDEEELRYDSELTSKLMDNINSTRKVFISGATMGSIFFIRCAIGATLTEETHVENLWKLVKEETDNILLKV